ncbi:type II toxin-antitoxin system Phd/YefM family antitoxin [Oscillospiraceae bacterium OttesenSCG-928-F05]|nr:type II toxin-antitoxin system Phd/YefM family antitoxin [Oscillospiraceae bacterium OttesenSCG-928-F05]
MTLNTKQLVPLTDANQNFSKVVRVVEEQGLAVILRNNKPSYVIVSFDEYDEITALRQAKIEQSTEELLHENMDALKELAQ